MEFVALDNWSMAKGHAEQLDANLERHGLRQPTILEGDAFETLRGGVLDGRRSAPTTTTTATSTSSSSRAFALSSRISPPPALVIVDDTDWERVERAVDDYLAQQPRATEILRTDGKDRGHPEWWEGMRVLRWD